MSHEYNILRLHPVSINQTSLSSRGASSWGGKSCAGGQCRSGVPTAGSASGDLEFAATGRENLRLQLSGGQLVRRPTRYHLLLLAELTHEVDLRQLLGLASREQQPPPGCPGQLAVQRPLHRSHSSGLEWVDADEPWAAGPAWTEEKEPLTPAYAQRVRACLLWPDGELAAQARMSVEHDDS